MMGNPSLRDTFLAVRAAVDTTGKLLTQIIVFTETCSIDTLHTPGANYALARALGSHVTTVFCRPLPQTNPHHQPHLHSKAVYESEK
jgi:hypothetical protein